MSGTDILPVWIEVLWIVALTAVLVFHCVHLARMGGQHRWFHLAHIVMIVGMIYMYASMAYALKWVSGTIWMSLYTVTTVAIVGWMLVRVVQKRPFSYLWLLALVQQAAMIYMWAPMSVWVAWFTYALAFYFLIETVAWLLGLCNDGQKGRANAVGPGDRATVVSLSDGSVKERISMAIMAASMSYMFVGMQLMR